MRFTVHRISTFRGEFCSQSGIASGIQIQVHSYCHPSQTITHRSLEPFSIGSVMVTQKVMCAVEHDISFSYEWVVGSGLFTGWAVSLVEIIWVVCSPPRSDFCCLREPGSDKGGNATGNMWLHGCQRVSSLIITSSEVFFISKTLPWIIKIFLISESLSHIHQIFLIFKTFSFSRWIFLISESLSVLTVQLFSLKRNFYSFCMLQEVQGFRLLIVSGPNFMLHSVTGLREGCHPSKEVGLLPNLVGCIFVITEEEFAYQFSFWGESQTWSLKWEGWDCNLCTVVNKSTLVRDLFFSRLKVCQQLTLVSPEITAA